MSDATAPAGLLVGCALAGPLPPMQRTVQVFLVPSGRAPAGAPTPVTTFTVEGPNLDALRAAARAAAVADGRRLRVVSVGPAALVVYVEATP